MTQGNIGLSNLQDEKSDQLVIQYRNTIGNSFDCEGNQINLNAYVVERYFYVLIIKIIMIQIHL
jgi:type IV pilus assembly protein PilW